MSKYYKYGYRSSYGKGYRIGSGGGYGYTSILEGADISLLESVSLAVWLCANAKERKKQIITY